MKQTEIGLIPDDWEVKSLGEVATIVGGGTPSTLNSAYWNGDIQWFTPAELSDSKKYVSKSERTITERGLKESSAKLLPKGTVLLTTRASIGITAILENPASTNQGFQSLIAKNNCCSEFLYYVIPLIKDEMLSRASGSTFAEISAKKLSTITFQLPPLPEQQRIAKALSDVDALISTTEKLIQKKKNIKQGAMQNLLTGKKRLPGFTKSTEYKQTELGLIPEDWDVITLSKYISDFIVPMRDKPTDLTGPIPWCRIEDFDGKYLTDSKTNQGVSSETIKKMNLKIFPVNTLLVSCSANLGKCAIVKKELITNQTFIGLVPNNNVDIEYLFYKMSFEEKRLNDMATGTTISYLSREQFENYEISSPSIKQEQTAIANVLSSMDKEIETLNTKLEKYHNLKTAMMQQLLTGKIRLR